MCLRLSIILKIRQMDFICPRTVFWSLLLSGLEVSLVASLPCCRLVICVPRRAGVLCLIPLESVTSGSLVGREPRTGVASRAALCYLLTDVFKMVATVTVITLHRMRPRSLIAFQGCLCPVPVPLARPIQRRWQELAKSPSFSL